MRGTVAAPSGLQWARQHLGAGWGSSTIPHAVPPSATIEASVIALPSPIEPHHQPLPDPGQPGHGLTLLAGPTVVMLRRRRWRDPQRDRLGKWLALLAVVLLHAAFLLMIRYEMRPPMVPTVVQEDLHDELQVRFITHAPRAAATPPPAAAPAPAPKPRPLPKIHEPLAKDAMTVQLPTPAPADTAHLYDKDGQPLLQPAPASSAPGSAYVQRMPEGDTRIMHNTDPIKYRPTRFEQYSPPPGESLGDAAVRHVVEAVVKSTEVNLPGGVHLECKTVLGVPTPSCKMPPAGPSAKDGDERLSMAPAKPLAADPHASAPPSEAACIAMYRAGKPLAYGCPIDTPNRAVDAELRERAARADHHP